MRKWLKWGITFVILGIAQRILDRFLDWSETALLPSFLGASFSDVLLVIMIVCGAFLIVWGVRSTSQRKNIIMPPPSQEKRTWFSKLRRAPVEKEKRPEFWTVAIVFGIAGATMIAIALSFLSTSILLKTTFAFFVIYTLIGAGILMITLSTLFMVTELYAMRESRKQLIIDRKNSYLNTLNSFDNSFKGLKKATQPETKAIRLDDFENWLHAICSDFSWDNEVSKRITEVLNYIPDNLSDDSLVDHYVSWLKQIINGHGKHTIPMIKGKFLTELEKMYENPERALAVNPKPVETDRDIAYILIELREYDGEYLIRCVNDAANRWSESRFQELASTIKGGFSGLSKRSPEEYRKFYNRLDEKMEVAERNKDEKAFNRLRFFRNSAKRYLLTIREDKHPQVGEHSTETQTFSEIIEQTSNKEMRDKRKLIIEKAEIIRQSKNIPQDLAEAIEEVAPFWDRIAIRLSIDDSARKRILYWIGGDVILPFWLAIEPYVKQQRERTIRKDFVRSLEQLANDYKKMKGES